MLDPTPYAVMAFLAEQASQLAQKVAEQQQQLADLKRRLAEAGAADAS